MGMGLGAMIILGRDEHTPEMDKILGGKGREEGGERDEMRVRGMGGVVGRGGGRKEGGEDEGKEIILGVRGGGRGGGR